MTPEEHHQKGRHCLTEAIQRMEERRFGYAISYAMEALEHFTAMRAASEPVPECREPQPSHLDAPHVTVATGYGWE